MYFDRRLNEMVNLTKRMFPADGYDNVVISCTGVTDRKGFSCFVANRVPSMHLTDTGMCYPLYYYEPREDSADLFDAGQDDPFIRRDGITDWSLETFRRHYGDPSITKEDIFWYSYAVLHAPDYRARFSADLQKVHPRIPMARDFRSYSDAGRALGGLHLNFDSVEPYPVTIKQGDLRLARIDDPESFYRVTRMKFAGKRGEQDKSTVIYNANITMQDIPLEAYDYVVNGKPALEWVMERQGLISDNPSGITNDTNLYARETMNNQAYPLELFQRVITVSLRTMEIIRGLPELEVEGEA